MRANILAAMLANSEATKLERTSFILTAAEHTTARLSKAKRDFAVASAGGRAYFAGGCADSGSTYYCDDARDEIEIFDASGRVAESKLAVARGWASGCSVEDKVVFAGGGTSDSAPRLSAVDVLDTKTMKVSKASLSLGRWGIGCASLQGSVYFGGGLSSPPFGITDVVDSFTPSSGFAVAPFKLSEARESIGTVATDKHLIFAGGWTGGRALKTIDVVDLAGSHVSTASLDLEAYWPGVAARGSEAFVVDGRAMHHFDGEAWERLPLPEDLLGEIDPRKSYEGGGAVPNAHVPGNGVTVGNLVCFYGYNPSKGSKGSAVHCYDAEQKTWLEPLPCSAAHKAGGIIAAGEAILVAGGYDETTEDSTDVVDIFSLKQLTMQV